MSALYGVKDPPAERIQIVFLYRLSMRHPCLIGITIAGRLGIVFLSAHRYGIEIRPYGKVDIWKNTLRAMVAVSRRARGSNN